MTRIFVSIPVPDGPGLESLRSELRAAGGVRVSPAEQTHVTLRFVGETDAAGVKRVVSCAEKAAEGIPPFRVTLAGAGAFPDRKRPSVVWIRAEPEGPMKAVSERLSAGLKEAGIGFDEKPFKSHVTLGRCAGRADLGEFFEKHRDGIRAEFLCDRILVMKSELGPKGAKHAAVAEIPLVSGD